MVSKDDAPSILVADGLAPSALTFLRTAGANVVEQHYPQAELGAALGEYDAVIIRSATTLTSEIIDAAVAGRLRVIGRAGVGVDNVDVAAAQAAGCWVLNTPGAPTTSLVELTLAHMLAAARGLQDADVGLKSHTWLKGTIRMGSTGGPRQGHELAGKRLGLLGFGRAAKGVAAAAGALGMQVHAYSHAGSEQREEHEAAAARMGVVLAPTAEALFKACSHVVVLCSLSEDTRGMVDRRLMEMMQQHGADNTPCGAHLFNLARGGIVVEEEAAACLDDGSLSTYATDVFATEPPPRDNALLRSPNFYATPHIGAATYEAQARVGMQIAASVLSALASDMPSDGVIAAPTMRC